MNRDQITQQLRAALEHEPRVNVHRDRVQIGFADGVATLEGEVADVAAKRLTLEHAAALPAVTGIVDRLRVRPSEPMGDGAIADHLEQAIAADTAFAECVIRRRVRGVTSIVRGVPAEDRGWWIEIDVDDGVVTLDGEVASLSHKRLAGVLAWCVPGSRDVVNGLGVEPDEMDGDGEVLDALRIVLEKDPFVDATRISASCENYVITLRGSAANKIGKQAAEADAWALFGVDRVVNRIELIPGS
jgi:osmotically-inducible protein OsmY